MAWRGFEDDDEYEQYLNMEQKMTNASGLAVAGTLAPVVEAMQRAPSESRFDVSVIISER